MVFYFNKSFDVIDKIKTRDNLDKYLLKSNPFKLQNKLLNQINL